jgi:hypothetical protein
MTESCVNIKMDLHISQLHQRLGGIAENMRATIVAARDTAIVPVGTRGSGLDKIPNLFLRQQ